jgi:hypothetical protein
MSNSVNQSPIKNFLGTIITQFESSIEEQGFLDKNWEKLGRSLALEIDVDIDSPLTLLTGDQICANALFIRMLQFRALVQKKAITVIVPEGGGLALTESLLSTQLCMDITLSSREWMNLKYFDSMCWDFKSIADSKIQIFDSPSLCASLSLASDQSEIDYLFVTGFPHANPEEALKTLKGYAAGRHIPVVVLNDCDPVLPHEFQEYVDIYYHMEEVEGLKYKMNVGAYSNDWKDDFTVMLSAGKKWIDTINKSCAYVLNSNARPNNKIPSDSSFYPKVFQDYELDKDEVVQLDFKM